MTHFRTHLAQSLIDDSTQNLHVSAPPKKPPKKPTAMSPSRTTTTIAQHHPAKQAQHQPTKGPTNSPEGRMEGEREGDQGYDLWKPRREVQRECDSRKAAHTFPTPQGVARQERVQHPSTFPKDGVGTPSSMLKTSRSQQPPTERKPQTPRTQLSLTYHWGKRRKAQDTRDIHLTTTDKQQHTTGAKVQTRSKVAPA